MKKLTLFLLLFLDICSYSQSVNDWFWISPKPTGEDLLASQFTSNNICYTVGADVILKSVNGGTTWTTLNAPKDNWASLSFISNSTGYVLSFGGKLIKTVNGGNTWTSLTISTNENFRGDDISFINANTGIVAGTIASVSKIYKTTNGGVSWSETSLGLNENYFSVKMISATIGYANGWYYHSPVHTNFVAKTTDGGDNWIITDSSFSRTAFFGKLDMISSTTGFVACSYPAVNIYRTTNAGMSWNTVNLLNDFSDIRSISFSNALTGVAIGSRSSFLRTTDGGSNWSRHSYADTNKVYNNISSSPNGNFIVTGDNGHIVRSGNNGVTFNRMGSFLTDENFSSCSFINANTGIVVGSHSTIFKTVNGGNSWTRLNIDSTFDLNKVIMLNQNLIFIVGNSRFVYKSSNGGTAWTKLLTEGKDWNSISFIDELNGCIASVSCRKNFAKTTDGGLTWLPPGINGDCSGPIETDYYFWGDVAMSTPNNIVLGGGEFVPHFGGISFINATTNGGINWSGQIGDQHRSMNTVCFAKNNPNFGYAAGGDNKNLVSHDGFATWINLTEGQDHPIVPSHITFLDSLHGYSVNYKTTNGGVNWFTNNQVYFNASDISYATLNTVYSVADHGKIMKTTNAGSTITGTEGNNTFADKFNLMQNYPNPFNPVTKISFEIPQNANVKLILYDILGREVARLVDANMNAGKHDITWDASNYSSGVYFYSLQAADYSNIKKMILVK